MIYLTIAATVSVVWLIGLIVGRIPIGLWRGLIVVDRRKNIATYACAVTLLAGVAVFTWSEAAFELGWVGAG